MLTLVVVLNGLISLLCLYIAWQVWELRRVLAKVADSVSSAERNTYRVLHNAPKAISQGQLGTRHLRKQYRQLDRQLQQVQQILVLFNLGQKIWRGKSTNFRV